MGQFSKRLPEVVTRKDLALMVAPTYAASADIGYDEAVGRMERVLANRRVAEELYAGLSAALGEFKGRRTNADELIDNLSAGISKRRARVKSAPMTDEISAAMGLLNLELGYAPEMMRGALESERGRTLYQGGMRALGSYLLGELIK